MGSAQQSFYLWKKKYAVSGLQELRELWQLRDENGKLKRLVADLSWTGTSFRRSSQKM
jgi:putative transposase